MQSRRALMQMGNAHVLKSITFDIPQHTFVNSATQLVAFIKNALPDVGILVKMELVGQPTIYNQFVQYVYNADFNVTSTRYRTEQGTAVEFAWNDPTISVIVVVGTQYTVQYIPSNVL